MRRSEAGFTLIEVVVAFAIVTIVLAALYQAIAGAWRGFARTQVREETLVLARAQLEAIGAERAVEAGLGAGAVGDLGDAADHVADEARIELRGAPPGHW
jgi:prepilin-type N-terminal cleavage/methylation domain-containing protein